MITIAGGTPITTGSATNWEMPIEKLVQADPELIILGDSAYGVDTRRRCQAPRLGWDDGGQAERDQGHRRHRRHPARSAPCRRAAPPGRDPPGARPARAVAGSASGGSTVATRQDALARRPPSSFPWRVVAGRSSWRSPGSSPSRSPSLPRVASARCRSRRPRRSAIIVHRLLGLDLAQTWTATDETIVWDLRLPRVLDGDGRRARAGGRRGDVPGPAPEPARRPVRARHGVGGGARGGDRRADPGADRDPRVRAAPGPRVRRGAASR